MNLNCMMRTRGLLPLLVLVTAIPCGAQERLKSLPGYERHERITRARTNVFKSGALTVTWKDDSQTFEYQHEGRRYRYDIASRQTTLLPQDSPTPPREPPRRAERATTSRPRPPWPARGRQSTWALSPDGNHRAFSLNRNLWLGDADGNNAFALTADGSELNRVKYATASWVYGEELEQRTAMWWSTNSQKLAYYRFDESRVRDFFLTLDLTRIQSALAVEPYVKAGGTNPVVDLLIYDLPTRRTVAVDARDGQPFDNEVLGHYVYGVSWSPDGSELLFHRTNRRQNIMELCACDPETGKCRVVVRESWLPSWTDNSPAMRFLKDGRRFLWISDRTGWKNLYLYGLGGGPPTCLTQHEFEVIEVLRVDEDAGWVYYTARDGDNPMKHQLHRVSLEGQGECRLTDPRFHHTVTLAPDGRYFVDVAQTHDHPPVTNLINAQGDRVDILARSDLTRFHQLNLKPVELLTFKAADGRTDLFGLLHFPSNFSPHRRYPLLVSVYAGPETTGARETFELPSTLTEYGFLLASFDSRSASGRGKRFLDAIYTNLGIAEIDDQAAGVRSLGNRRYVDRNRVGIFGTSYGGTASATCLLRYPEIFHAAVSSSPVTDYRHYDSIYTERYLGLPQENRAAYDAAAVLSYAKNLKGRLLLFFGTADDNVHPNNALQLVQSLQQAGKSFDLQVGPDLGHTSVHRERMMEYFIEHLVVHR